MSGLAFVNYLTYEVRNDSFLIIDNGNIPDTITSDKIMYSEPLEFEKVEKLKTLISKTDSLGNHQNLCVCIEQGIPRFYISFNENGRTQDGFISNVYRKTSSTFLTR